MLTISRFTDHSVRRPVRPCECECEFEKLFSFLRVPQERNRPESTIHRSHGIFIQIGLWKNTMGPMNCGLRNRIECLVRTCMFMLSCCGARSARSIISPKYASCALMTSSKQHARCTASCRVSHADSITSNIKKAERLFTTCIIRPRINVHLY